MNVKFGASLLYLLRATTMVVGLFFTVQVQADQGATPQVVELNGAAGGKRFDGIGAVNGGGATSVLLKDYPEPQRSQILDLLYKPNFGASMSALLVEIPGDGNSTQGSMPSHMHTKDDLNYGRGYIWWILKEARKRNPDLSLDAAAWSAPGWIGNGKFWSQDTCDYYVKWIQGLKSEYGVEIDALGCRNEKGTDLNFPKNLRATLNAAGLQKVKIHGFDDWPANSLDFVKDMAADDKLRDAVDIISAHTFMRFPASLAVQEMAAQMNKPIWNTEEHVYKKGYDCEISLVHALNTNFIQSGATRITCWYDVAALYPVEPYSEDPSMLLARSPWSGNYSVREVLWGYAHYGQFSKVGWQYLKGGCGNLNGGGTFITLKSPGDDYSVIMETQGATSAQQLSFHVGGGLSNKELCVWSSNEKEQFIRQADIKPVNGVFTISLEPNSIYSLSTATGQQKGSFPDIPAEKPFPFPYAENFDEYTSPGQWGFLPHYLADIAGVFEIADRPDGKGKCLHQVVPLHAISWAPEWQPYTIIGDAHWTDYDVSADVYLNPGDRAGVMGRINSVGTGFRSVPEGYSLQLGSDGKCSLSVIRGIFSNKPVGDAEQQALFKGPKPKGETEEKVLGTSLVPHIGPGQWHHLKLRFSGTTLTGFVDGAQIVTATDDLYPRGMAGLLAGGGKNALSTPFYDNLLIDAVDTPARTTVSSVPDRSPIYDLSHAQK